MVIAVGLGLHSHRDGIWPRGVDERRQRDDPVVEAALRECAAIGYVEEDGLRGNADAVLRLSGPSDTRIHPPSSRQG